MEVLSRPEWTARAAAHRARLSPYVSSHLARREARLRHPVHDFLFTYYSFRPAQLLRWHPGFGVALADAPEYSSLKGYAVSTGSTASVVGATSFRPVETTVDPRYVSSQRVLVKTLHRLLRATAGRTANLGCFGLHEWAMVYRLSPEEVRHRGWPLRLGSAGTDAVVESHRITCSHFDAYRFFTPAAVELNTLRPAAQDREAYEQPGCLHGTMDLYKHAFRLAPMIPSDLVADCFELAWDVRIMDMRAAPYDLTGITLDPTGEEWTPIDIESADGKREYADLQRRFADRAAPLRQRLIEECERLLACNTPEHRPPAA
ncbi:MAG: 3-methyladenine DNA glycosylase [Nocardioides sp.]|nr:3-methyladenine DNA glycosylase [Nocardioides sp.]